MFIEFIEKNGMQVWLENNEKAEAYARWLIEVGDDRFVQRHPVRRNKHEIAANGKFLEWEAADMLDPNLKIYPSPTKDWYCTRCPFRAPCLAADDGGDAVALLKANYVSNVDR